jgi:chaperonin GroEL
VCVYDCVVDAGIVPGGGTALLYASMCLDGMKMENFDQEVGVKIVRNAIRVPCQTIADNAGMEGVYHGRW